VSGIKTAHLPCLIGSGDLNPVSGLQRPCFYMFYYVISMWMHTYLQDNKKDLCYFSVHIMGWTQSNETTEAPYFTEHYCIMPCYESHERKLILITWQFLLLHSQYLLAIFLHSSCNLRGNGRISHKSIWLIVSFKSNQNFRMSWKEEKLRQHTLVVGCDWKI
jgi:hypothetical protein